MAAAVVLTLGVPVLAMIQPGAPAAQVQAQDARTPPGTALGTALGTSLRTPPKEAERGREAVDMPAAAILGSEIRRLSDEADSVDRLWAAYGEQCGAAQVASTQPTDFGRVWFAVLDAPERGAGGHCAELLQLIRQSGEGIRRDLRRALSAARKARVDTGTEVGLLRWHSLELP